MKAFRFLKDKWFYISLIIMLLVVVGVFFFTFNRLDKFTRHGEEFPVPDFIGMNYAETVENYKDDFTFILLDSIYVKDFPEGAVYQQNPSPGANVKKGRNIYIIRSSIAPEVIQMPNLRNLSLRQAIVTLDAVGLKVDKLEFIDYFARNAVIEQKMKDKVINPKEKVVKGSAITLVVGLGKGDKTTNLPDLVGVNIENAKYQINNASLNIGAEIFVDDDDPENLFVFRMDPYYSQDKKVPLGSMVNVWYKSTKNFDIAWYRHEKNRRDSIMEVMRIKKVDPDRQKYVIDSFNYILSHRKFSYDPTERKEDKKMLFKNAKDIDDFEFEIDLDNNNYEIDTNIFYDE